MGCDIHLHTEIKVGGVWHHYSQPRIGRSYWLFCKMAGVRGPIDGITPIAEPRGLPADLSFTTKFDADKWDSDAHSHSWLTGKELAEAIGWYDKVRTESAQKEKQLAIERGDTRHVQDWFSAEHEFFGYLFGNGWDFEKYPDDYPDEIEDVRAVFWFDN